ncbi:unnamed protein product [Microthlaspi erraticum]|uniref:Uncharacterized protein n=1 Tax=Microthlaspi erraticum TaxID=1685480 RepID=A0A6D2JWX3_9BRAS|nr:unnamed protein product [Microthlaspi erraticum]
MLPNPRSVAAQGCRSIGSRRNFSSSHGSNGETQSLYEAFKSLYKNPDSKGSMEFKEKLKERGIAVLTGVFLGFLTMRKPSWELTRAFEETFWMFSYGHKVTVARNEEDVNCVSTVVLLKRMKERRVFEEMQSK